MKQYIIFLLVLAISFNSNADSWRDLSWKEMLDSSQLVAKVKYISNGDKRAKATILKVYKGFQKKGDEIWITGFSNRYGPHDIMHKGDIYLVFLDINIPTEKRILSLKNELPKKPKLEDFLEAYKNNKSYSVQTPTSGDYRIKGKKIQYNFFQTSYDDEQKFYPLDEFENFLKYYYINSSKDIIYNELLNKVNNNSFRNIMMLYLLKYNKFDTIFISFINSKDELTKYALAILMGNIKTKQSRDLLIKLLDDNSSLVQGESVRQLANEPAEFIAPILLKHLNTASKKNYGASNVMNPVRNTIRGSKREIIKTLGNMEYKPAIPYLIPLLDTKDEYEFRFIAAILKKLGSKDYIPYINKHLENLDGNMLLQLCFIIKEDSLTECIPSLMKFVKYHNKIDWPIKEYAVTKSYGLAYFNTDTIRKFLFADFLDVLKIPNSSYQNIEGKERWINLYLDIFEDLEISQAKPYIYDYLFNYYSFNNEFKTQTKMFDYKQQFQDSIKSIVKIILKDGNIVEVRASAFVSFKNNKPKMSDYSVKITVNKNAPVKVITSKLVEAGIPIEHIIIFDSEIIETNGETFQKPFVISDMLHLISYISHFADKEDIEFMENLKKYNFTKSESEIKKLEEYLIPARNNFQKR